ncbi:MAG: hypothetical protein QOH68_3409 [Nocardioidaceae bacterium]|jgi:hypothetical protein|nr:hypothetical protein [Nocardioidaceae bacterium]
MSDRVQTHLRNNVIGYVALFFALTAGAYAASHAQQNSVTSKSVRNGSLRGVDVHHGSITGSDVDESTLDVGPRAYGQVDKNAVLSRSKDAATVGNPKPGVFCVTLPELDPATAPMIVGADHASDQTSFGNPLANDVLAMQEWNSAGADCPSGQYEVETGGIFVRPEAAGGTYVQRLNGGFTFVVP